MPKNTKNLEKNHTSTLDDQPLETLALFLTWEFEREEGVVNLLN